MGETLFSSQYWVIGVPFTNYLGWCLTVFLFLMAFALYRAARPKPARDVPQTYWYQACVLFAVMAAIELLPNGMYDGPD